MDNTVATPTVMSYMYVCTLLYNTGHAYYDDVCKHSVGLLTLWFCFRVYWTTVFL